MPVDEHLGGAGRVLDEVEGRVRGLIGDSVFGTDGDTMESVVLGLLEDRGLTLGVAESLTGGLIAARLTETVGASAAFRGGVVARAGQRPISSLRTSGLSSEQVGVSPGPCQDQFVVAVMPDQQPVGLYVAFPVVLPSPRETVSPVAVGESAPGLEMLYHIPQFLQIFAASGCSLEVIPESAGVSQSHRHRQPNRALSSSRPPAHSISPSPVSACWSASTVSAFGSLTSKGNPRRSVTWR